jgi:hypothetical protein
MGKKVKVGSFLLRNQRVKMAKNLVIKELIHKPFSLRPPYDNLRMVNKGNNSS